MAEQPSFPAAQMKEATRFSMDLLKDRQLTADYFKAYQTAVKDKTYETQIIDNFLTQKGYTCTLEEVLQAQRNLPAYKLYFWSGVYETKLSASGSTTSTDGEAVAIHGFDKGAQDVSYGDMFIIGPQFQNRVLSWSSEGGVNSSSASLTFALSAGKQGTTVKSFYGTFTDSSGAPQNIVGTYTTVAQIQKDKKKTPTGVSLKTIQYIEAGLNMFAQITFIGLNFYMMYKTKKELEEMKKSGASKEEIEKKQGEADNIEGETENSTQRGESANDRLQDIPEEDYKGAMDPTVESSGTVPVEVPPAPEPPTAEQQEALGEAVEAQEKEALEAQGEEQSSEGEEGEDEGGEEDEGGDDVLSDIGGLFEGEGE